MKWFYPYTAFGCRLCRRLELLSLKLSLRMVHEGISSQLRHFHRVFRWSENCHEITSSIVLCAVSMNRGRRSLSNAESGGNIRKTIKVVRYSNETAKNIPELRMTNFMVDTIPRKLAFAFRNSIETRSWRYLKPTVMKKKFVDTCVSNVWNYTHLYLFLEQ